MDYQTNSNPLGGENDSSKDANPVDLVPFDSTPGPNETTTESAITKQKNPLLSHLMAPILIVSIIAMLVAIGFAIIKSTQRMSFVQQSAFPSQQVNLSSLDLPVTGVGQDSTSTLTVNGQLAVGGTLTFNPSARPSVPRVGQIYFDQSSNKLGYYNGTSFEYLQGGSDTPAVNNHTAVVNPSVQLQSGAPGTAQLGNLNIAGTGTIGVINATQINGSVVNGTQINAGAVNTTRIGSGNNGFSINQYSSGSSGAGAMFGLSSTGQASFRNTDDSLNAFSIQNAASTSTLFSVDTYNMRIAIGKPTADYLLDIGDGDVNMVSGRSLRFGGTKVLSASNTSTALSGNNVTVQSGNFAVQSSDGGTNYLIVNSGGETINVAATFNNGATFAQATTFYNGTTYGGAATFNNTTAFGGAATFNSSATFAGTATFDNNITNITSSTMAFNIQNTSNISLFTADTTNMVISITGTDTSFANLTLSNAHIKSTQTTPPTITVPTNCGANAAAAITSGSTDTAGSFVITTGTDSTSSTCDTTLTFHQPYGTAPKSIIVVGQGNATTEQRGIYMAGETTTNFSVSFANSSAGVNNTPYKFSYWVIE